MGRHWRIGVTPAILLLTAGCLASRSYPPPELPPSALRNVEPAPSREATAPVSLTSASGIPKRPRAVLAISGGGLLGAYSVGVLKGWSDSGRRPEFDVVTGVSTGALIAPFAFLGSEYDGLLENWYTTAKPDDVARRRFLPTLLWSDSVADSAPLRQRIDTVVSPELLERIAQAHASGRRLYVGTTNLDTKRLVVWDLGAIAASDAEDKLELVRKVLLASCAVPGLMPPVPIDIEVNGQRRTELHVDGGVTAAVFVPPSTFATGPAIAPPAAAESATVSVIVSGKVTASRRPVPRRLLIIAQESLNGVLRAQVRADLQQVSLLASRAGAGFQFTSLPDDFGASEPYLILDPPALRRLFDVGYRIGADGNWREAPPGLDANEQPPPRTGSRFTTIDRRAAGDPPRSAPPAK